jgi:hypothetical protein
MKEILTNKWEEKKDKRKKSMKEREEIQKEINNEKEKE